MDDFLYYGAFISEDSKKYMLNVLISDKIPEHSKIYMEHCTLLHSKQLIGNEPLKQILDMNLNKSLIMNIDAIGKSDKAMAFRVCSLEGISANPIPHITICTFNGGTPVDSNNITEWEKIYPISIRGIIKKIVR